MSERVTKAIHYAILTIIAIIFVLPLVWLILAAFDLNASQALKWPSQWTLSNFTSVLTNTDNLRGFGVGLTISLIQSLIVVLVSGLAAYPLSRYHLTFKKQFMYVILFMTALPMIAVIVPVYKMFLNIGLLDSIPGVILYLTASALPYGIWLMKNFMDGVPVELEEACFVDGGGPWRNLISIYVPLAKPMVATVALFTMVMYWNEFFQGMVLSTRQTSYPLQTYIQQMVVTLDYSTMNVDQIAQAMKLNNLSLDSAKIFIAMIPVLIVYPFLQRYFVEGITLGSVKG